MRGYVKKIKQKAEKLSKEQIISLLDTMTEENETLYSIIESLSTGLLIVDNDFHLIQSNTIVKSRLNFSTHLDDTTDVPIWEIIEDKEIADFLRKCAEKKITNSSEEFSTITSGGTVRFMNITLNPLNMNGNLCGRIILIRDITDKKNQDVLLHRMENMANLTTLAAGMAHEIKNPLGAISIHMQLIQKALNKARDNNDVLPPKKFVEDHIDVVNEEIDHLNKLVMDFLFAVRPVNATLQLKNPGEVIENIADFFKAEFNRFKVKVDLQINDDGKKIMMDDKLFRDVIINLSQNALAAIKSRFPECNEEEKCEPEDYKGLFLISCQVKENRYIINVCDNGCGMSPETVAKVFEPYYTTKANGTGLGMTTVYKIVKEFSGEILVDSEEGVGSKFTLVFPLPQANKKLIK